ncbi:MAG: hypothetical protein JXQ76_04115 [Campylobacterales bacterium]|nr:hypothetical protein [Campylobacterales bacterium]
MRKVLLIEDRSERQQRFMQESKIDLTLYSNILDNAIDEAYSDVFKAFKSSALDWEQYSVFMVHKGAFEEDNSAIIKEIETHCKTTQKSLILFSGGVDSNYYLEEEGFVLMELNSKTLYSQNIKLFLEEFAQGVNQPLILSYGKKWRVNILLNSLEKINYILETMPKEYMLYKRFVQDSKIELIEPLEIELYSVNLEGKRIYQDEIIKLRTDILAYIQKVSYA